MINFLKYLQLIQFYKDKNLFIFYYRLNFSLMKENYVIKFEIL